MSKNIVINDPNEGVLIKALEARTDIKAERIKRLLRLPDLTKKENSPVKIVADQIIKLPRFEDFDLMDFPKIVTVADNFDVLNTPKDHPSRRESDTYYLNDSDILRTQTTSMWPYYLRNPEILKKLEEEGEIKEEEKEIQTEEVQLRNLQNTLSRLEKKLEHIDGEIEKK